MLKGGMVDEPTRLHGFGPGVRIVGRIGEYDFGLPVEDDQDLLLEVGMRRMRRDSRIEHRSVTGQIPWDAGSAVEEEVGLPASVLVPGQREGQRMDLRV